MSHTLIRLWGHLLDKSVFELGLHDHTYLQKYSSESNKFETPFIHWIGITNNILSHSQTIMPDKLKTSQFIFWVGEVLIVNVNLESLCHVNTLGIQMKKGNYVSCCVFLVNTSIVVYVVLGAKYMCQIRFEHFQYKHTIIETWSTASKAFCGMGSVSRALMESMELTKKRVLKCRTCLVTFSNVLLVGF